MTDRPVDHDRPSRHGAILGVALFQIAEAGRRALGMTDDKMCATCAFRPGSVPNQSAATGLIAYKCATGVDPDPFGCHHGVNSDGKSTRLCAGYLAAKHAPFDMVKDICGRLADIVSDLEEGPDEIRAAYDAWASEIDPDRKMDAYQLARAWLRREAATVGEAHDSL